jgi:hypothetical protein
VLSKTDGNGGAVNAGSCYSDLGSHRPLSIFPTR